MKEKKQRTGFEIAIVGMSGRFPGANNLHEFWDNLKHGVHSIRFFTEKELLEKSSIDPEMIKLPNFVKAKGIIENTEYFDAYFFGYSPLEAEVLDPQVRIFSEICWEALEDAGCDPSTYYGPIGVYAGGSASRSWEVLTVLTRKGDTLGQFTADILSDKDYLSAHISHKLDLKGPSMTLFTACSTGLVAVDLACRSLLTGQCDAALAGGVSAQSENANAGGYIYNEGMINSPDGYVRAFDAKAGGTVFSSGAGAVLLKRLESAIADRDSIYAVIKGFAVNNDGLEKSGFTAPSVDGQVGAVQAALHMAEIEPKSVTYIEAHGTATEIGDPIEVEALKTAFHTDKKQYCAIGSVKTNIGHLDVAAGIAGLIKVVLMLKHRQIPPSLHYEKPNPRIDFENSPFFVNTRLREWKHNEYPLRAGVSSFGVGGGNAHVVLEEWPGVEGSREGPGGTTFKSEERQEKDYQLILLSAKTGAALDKMTENLANYLTQNPDFHLADIAYTLKLGRKTFDHRKMLVCKDAPGAVSILQSSSVPEAGGGPFAQTHYTKEVKRAVFMFPGQGSQYVDMARDLYEKEPLFRREIDHCFEILRPITGHDFKKILYPSLEENESDRSHGSYKTYTIDQTEITQPVIFIIEYALAKLLMAWGVKPHAMIGHSIGEYTAACLSGVFSLADALTVVAWRGKLMQQMPEGSMLSVSLPQQQLVPSLTQELALAAVNGPSQCVVSGPHNAVEAFARQLEEKGRQCRKLHTSHAYHSPMMDPILKTFEMKVAQVQLNQPRIPFISNVTGQWINNRDAVDPAYWARHLRETVRFNDGLTELLKEKNSLFIEVGPGRTLSAFIKQHPGKQPEHTPFNLVRHPNEEIADEYYLTEKIGLIWLYGLPVDWLAYYGEEKRNRLHLPTYPFQRQRYWIEGNPAAMIREGRQGKPAAGKKSDISDWFYIPSWKKSVIAPGKDRKTGGERWLVFAGEGNFAAQLVKKLAVEQENHVTVVLAGKEFSKQGEGIDAVYTIDPGKESDYEALIKELEGTGDVPCRVVHLWNLSENENRRKSENIEKYLDLGFYSLLYLARALGNSGSVDSGNSDRPIEMTVLTDGMQQVWGEKVLYPEKAVALGPVMVIPREYPESPTIKCRCIDIIPQGQGEGNDGTGWLLERLIKELHSRVTDELIAYRGESRLVRTFAPAPLAPAESPTPRLRQGGVYLITGGLGGIGLELARLLARTVRAKLILTGRSPFPAREEWEKWLGRHDNQDGVCHKIHKIKELESLGAHVRVYSVDVTDAAGMRKVVQETIERFGTINGVIHAAGLPGGGVIRLKTREMADKILAPKVKGALALNTALQDARLDFFILCSSVNSVLSIFGQVDYCAANAFLDAFAFYKSTVDNIFTVSINWDTWGEIGMAVEAAKQFKSQDGSAGHWILPAEGVEAFTRILAQEMPLPQVVVSTLELAPRIRALNSAGISGLAESSPGSRPGDAAHSRYERPNVSSAYAAPTNETEQKLALIWQELLGIDQVGVNDDFFDLGGDSLKATLLVAKIKQAFNSGITVREIFNSPRIRDLSKYIEKSGTDNIAFDPLEAVEEKEFYTVSPAQKRLYILNEMEGISTAYNLPSFIETEGKPDIPRLEKIFQLLVQRHESLRTSFVMKTGGPVQIVHKYVDFHIEFIETNENKKNETIKQFIRPFDLSKPPLLRVAVIKLAEEEYILAFDIHHIVSDGTSCLILVRDLNAFYNEKPLPELKISYKDFSEWQNSELPKTRLKRQKEYWLDRLKGEIPTLNIYSDYPRPPVQSFEGERINFELDEVLTRELAQLMKETVTTLYMVLLAALYILLSRYSGREDIIVGSPVAARELVELENVIGLFINALPIRNYPVANKTFAEFLTEVKNNTIKAYDNQGYPFGELLEELGVTLDISRQPLYDVELIIQNMEVAGLEMEKGMIVANRYDAKGAQLDISLEATEGNEKIQLALIYCTKLFKRETMDRFIRHYINCIREVVKNPAIKLAEPEIMDEEEKRRLLVDFNDTAMDYPWGKTITGLFEEQVERTPDRIAVFGHALSFPPVGPVNLSYSALNEQSDRLAGLLIEKGVLADNIVGIMIERSIEMFIGIWGILKAGGAYLPIDPDYPRERIDYMLADSNAKIIVGNRHACSEEFNCQLSIVNCELLMNVLEAPVHHSSFDFPRNHHSNQLAYIIFTSGSTGRPKGVMVRHDNFVNAAFGWIKEYRLSTFEVNLLQIASFSFDVFSGDMARALLCGGKLVICPGEVRGDFPTLYSLVKNHRITLFEATPSLVIPFMQYVYENRLDLRYLQLLIIGSDVCPLADFKQLAARSMEGNRMRVINSYGVTEATIDSSYYEERLENIPLKGNAPIGKPFPNAAFYILDSVGNLAPEGIPGELYIGGSGVTPGYLNNPELTAEKFIHFHHSSFDLPRIHHSKLYCTGDLARWLSDGNVEFLGRVDYQVKIRGFRIELEEIERRVAAHKDIKETVVLANDDSSGNKYLCAYIVPVGDRKNEPFSIPDLRDYLFGLLPGYMIPSHFIEIPEIPLTANGKVDRKALLALETGEGIATEYVPPSNEVERKLADMWSEILMRDRVGIHDNFFDLGGQSLKAMRLMAMIKEIFDAKIPLIVFFQVGTIKGIAELISRGRGGEDQSLSSLKFEKKKRREREV
ncbi:MAG: amino acid adenylation domain-containing protein [Candidatus Aminicenantes bacterium]|nr:amino acid adenylation domain-containing protein [Candidatus Aminicenantes bacterium]